MIEKYWGEERVYHHTAPITMNYALLRGAAPRRTRKGSRRAGARHERNHEALVAGLEALGLELAAQEGHQLWMLNSVRIPDGVDDAAVRQRAARGVRHRDRRRARAAEGQGLAHRPDGRVEHARPTCCWCCSALERVLPRCGHAVEAGAGVAAAAQRLA